MSIESVVALFDLLRADVTRLQRNLGAEERRKLQEVLSAVEALERRDDAIRAQSEFLQACAPRLGVFEKVLKVGSLNTFSLVRHNALWTH